PLPLASTRSPATSQICTLSHTTLFRSQFVALAAYVDQDGAAGRVDTLEAVPVVVDALIGARLDRIRRRRHQIDDEGRTLGLDWLDRKSTRLNSSHVSISYAVFCLKKKI